MRKLQAFAHKNRNLLIVAFALGWYAGGFRGSDESC